MTLTRQEVSEGRTISISATACFFADQTINALRAYKKTKDLEIYEATFIPEEWLTSARECAETAAERANAAAKTAEDAGTHKALAAARVALRRAEEVKEAVKAAS